jgi:hypothetical protein
MVRSGTVECWKLRFAMFARGWHTNQLEIERRKERAKEEEASKDGQTVAGERQVRRLKGLVTGDWCPTRAVGEMTVAVAERPDQQSAITCKREKVVAACRYGRNGRYR